MRILSLNEHSELEIYPELLGIKYFKDIWERDETEDKRIALDELSFIYYMCDVTSIYYVIEDTLTRQKNIFSDGILPFLPDTWKPDTKVLAAIKYYNKIQDSNDIIQTFKAARGALKNIKKYLETIDFTLKNTKTGALVNDPKVVASVLKDVRALTTEYKNAEIEVLASQNTENEYVGNEKKSLFDDGIAL